MKINEAIDLVVDAIRENITLDASQINTIEDDPQSFVILGGHENIDSLDLVSILADIEAKVFEQLNITIMLSSDKAMSHVNSPFRNIGSLSAFLIEEIENA